MVNARRPPGFDDAGLTPAEQADLEDMRAFRAHETGYQAIQGSKPQTLAYALNDSPAGLAGWIVEKFRTWSDCGGDLESAIARDDLLANLTTYWVTGTAGSSARLYYESAPGCRRVVPDGRVEVPTAVAALPARDLPAAARRGSSAASTCAGGP